MERMKVVFYCAVLWQ